MPDLTMPDLTSEPIFAFTETSYIEAFWYVPLAKADWLAMVYRDTPDGPWRATFRVRYYVTDDVWDGQDVKKAYDINPKNGRADGSEARRQYLIAGFDHSARSLRKFSREASRPPRVDVQGNLDKFLTIYARQPWAHCRVIPEAGATIQ